MTEDDLRAYFARFNARDLSFSEFYCDDVEFNLGDRKQIVGKQGIVDFYAGVWDHIHEKLDVLDLVVGPTGAALLTRTTFTTVKDWPDFELWPTTAGDVMTVESLVLYRFRDGKLSNIKSARYRKL